MKVEKIITISKDEVDALGKVVRILKMINDCQRYSIDDLVEIGSGKYEYYNVKVVKEDDNNES